jgi:hypothetical protein
LSFSIFRASARALAALESATSTDKLRGAVFEDDFDGENRARSDDSKPVFTLRIRAASMQRLWTQQHPGKNPAIRPPKTTENKPVSKTAP